MNLDPPEPKTANELRWWQEVQAIREVVGELNHKNLALEIENARYRMILQNSPFPGSSVADTEPTITTTTTTATTTTTTVTTTTLTASIFTTNTDSYYRSEQIDNDTIKDCLKKPNIVEMTECQHNRHKLPPWKSGDRQERLLIISKNFDPDIAINARENIEISGSSCVTLLPYDEIKKVMKIF
jgi:hypothetical protein